MKKPDDREVFSLVIDVKENHLDQLNHVNNVVYLQWVQDVASAHWEARAGNEWLAACRWVVIRHEIDYFKSAELGDQITAYTWIDPALGVKQHRHVRFERGGEVIAQAVTVWCLLNPTTGKPMRISPEISSRLGLRSPQN